MFLLIRYRMYETGLKQLMWYMYHFQYNAQLCLFCQIQKKKKYNQKIIFLKENENK